MVGKGIDDDLLIINKAVESKHGHIVAAVIDNELTCKTLYLRRSSRAIQSYGKRINCWNDPTFL